MHGKWIHSASRPVSPCGDTTFEPHYTLADLAGLWKLGRETIRLLIKDEPGVVRVRMGRKRAMTRYSVPESVARRVHTKLFLEERDFKRPHGISGGKS